MKIMNTHSRRISARGNTHETETTQIAISDALRRRAQSIINDRSINPQWRAIIRFALEIKDPLLPDLVRRADAGETVTDIMLPTSRKHPKAPKTIRTKKRSKHWRR
jgi:hypothetical protein